MLAIWEYFWDWAGAPVVAPEPDSVTPGRGSGKSEDIYRTLPDDYWETLAESTAPPKEVAPETLAERQERLRMEVQAILAEQQQILFFRQQVIQLQQALPLATEIEELKRIALQLKALQVQLTALEATNKARIVRAKSLRFSLYH